MSEEERADLIRVIKETFDDVCFGSDKPPVSWYDQEGEFEKVWPFVADAIIAAGWNWTDPNDVPDVDES